MAISKLNFNSLNVTPTASKGIGFDSGADDLEASFQGGSMVFIKKLTASSSATLDFVHGSGGVDFSTHKEYVFIFNNLHPQTDDQIFTFQGSIDAGSNYNVAITSTTFFANHNEADSTAALGYQSNFDQAQGTAFQQTSGTTGSDNDQCNVGILHLFNPSSTTFVKHFICRTSIYSATNYAVDANVAGYFNTTSDIDAMQFKYQSGNIDAGTITLYGIA